MNGTDCYPLDDYIATFFLPVMYGIIFAVGLVGNLTSIIIYVVRLRPWKINSIIMVNLALADLQLVLALPFLVHYYITEDWIFGDTMCRAVRFGFHFNLYCSILLLTCLSVCRYVAVVHPLRAVQMQRKRWALVICLAVWLTALLEITPMLFIFTVEKTENNMTICLDFASNNPQDVWVYSWLLTAVGYFLPLVVVCVSYIQAARELSTGPHEGRISRLRARKMTVLILVVFVLCFTPYHILRALRVYTRIKIQHSASCVTMRGVNAAYTISRPLAGLNTFFNLALYTLAGDEFHRVLFEILRWRPTFLKNSSTKKFLVVEVVSQPGSRISQTKLIKI